MHRLIFLLLIGSMPAFVAAQTRLELSLGSENLFRGIRQTASGPAYGGSLDYHNDKGLYAGFWAGRVNYELPSDERNAEVDYFAGYQRRLSANLGFDIGITRYTYHGGTLIDYDWTEAHLTASLRDRWSFTMSVGDNWLGRERTNVNTSLTYRHPVSATISTDLTVGHQQINNEQAVEYQYATLGIIKSWGPLDLRCAFSTTHDAEFFHANADSRWDLQARWTVF